MAQSISEALRFVSKYGFGAVYRQLIYMNEHFVKNVVFIGNMQDALI